MSILGNDSSAGKKPTTPVIGTATDGGTGTTVSVPFTPSTYIGKGTITYTALSTPGSISATSSGTPITVTGLTTGTTYTFTVTGNTNYGVASDASSASNSITPLPPGKYESIATVNGSGSGGISIQNIPQTYRHLQLRIVSSITSGTSAQQMTMRFNNVGTAIYWGNYQYSNSTGGSRGGNLWGAATAGNLGWSASVGMATGAIGCTIVDIFDYTQASRNKTYKFLGSTVGGNGTEWYTSLGTGFSNTSAAISRLDFDLQGNASTISSFALYGMKDS